MGIDDSRKQKQPQYLGHKIYNPKKELPNESHYVPEKRQPTSPSMLRYSSLIPTTLIKTHFKKNQNKRLIINDPPFKSQYTHSKFPYRKPKTKRSLNTNTTYFPIYKQKMSTASVYQTSKTKQIEPRQKVKVRVTSCFDLKHQEEQKLNFVRYSQNHLKTEYIERKHQTSQKFEEVGRLYVSP